MTKEDVHSDLTPDCHVSDALEEISCTSFERAISYIASDADKHIPECNIPFCRFLRDYWVKSVAAEMVQRYITGLAWEGFSPPAEYLSDKELNNILSDKLSNNCELSNQELWEDYQDFQSHMIMRSKRMKTNSALELQRKTEGGDKSNTITTTCLGLLALTGMQGGVTSFRQLGQEYASNSSLMELNTKSEGWFGDFGYSNDNLSFMSTATDDSIGLEEFFSPFDEGIDSLSPEVGIQTAISTPFLMAGTVLSLLPAVLSDHPLAKLSTASLLLLSQAGNAEGSRQKEVRGDNFPVKNKHKKVRKRKERNGRIKKAETPNDGRFQVKIRTGKDGCIIPYKYKGIVYPYINYVDSDNCKKVAYNFRYDVLGRIQERVSITYENSVNDVKNNKTELPIKSNVTFAPPIHLPTLNETTKEASILPGDEGSDATKSIWLCLTEPTYFKGGEWEYLSGYSWDYLRYQPCSVNDPRQRFTWVKGDESGLGYFKNTASGRQVGEYSWTLSTSKNVDLNLLKVKKDQWVKTVAQPSQETMGVAFPINWRYGDYLYPLTGINEGGRMIYDPYTNHLMDADDYQHTCLKSVYTTTWDWASLESCSDISSQWKPVSFSIGQQGDAVKHFVMMQDAKGNMLRVPRTGSHWGDPYTVTKDYLSKDTTSSPTSYFETNSALRNWKRYSRANYFRQLPSCPAKGYGLKKTMNKLPALTLLPKDFKLNGQWLERLWALSRGQYKEETTAGGMGSCSLIAIAMLQEILEYGSVGQQPLSQSDPGLFFNVGRSINPVDSFRSRRSEVAEELDSEEELLKISITTTESVEGRMTLYEALQSLYLSSLIEVGMHYFVGRRAYNPSGGPIWVEHLNVLWADMMALPHNALSYFHFHGMNSGQLIAHAYVALRENEGGSNGIRLIPTNIADMSLEAFTIQSQRVFANQQELFDFLPRSTSPAFTDIRGVMFFQASESSEESADTVNEERVLSSDDACATGASGYGTGVLLPNVSDLNQCYTTDGRCNSDRRSKKRKG